MNGNDFRSVQNKCRMQNGLAVNSKGQSGDLVLMWGDGINVSIQSYSKHHIESIFNLENNKNMFGGSVREDWVVGEDFNAILNDAEKEGGRRGQGHI
ncbi:hypothetical protein EPI10_005749 [Gossypium australe]|uniref:Reverse transcriptase n=1 Tax=Gossypium australe TaxID=47621 RepID=A0A5B6WP79_9ROSI|nr:hypothetical protein EPI10_005749 [Gossypium australe]